MQATDPQVPHIRFLDFAARLVNDPPADRVARLAAWAELERFCDVGAVGGLVARVAEKDRATLREKWTAAFTDEIFDRVRAALARGLEVIVDDGYFSVTAKAERPIVFAWLPSASGGPFSLMLHAPFDNLELRAQVALGVHLQNAELPRDRFARCSECRKIIVRVRKPEAGVPIYCGHACAKKVSERGHPLENKGAPAAALRRSARGAKKKK